MFKSLFECSKACLNVQKHVGLYEGLSCVCPCAVTAHLVGMHSAIEMMVERTRLIAELLHKVQRAEVPYPHALLRQVRGPTGRGGAEQAIAPQHAGVGQN